MYLQPKEWPPATKHEWNRFYKGLSTQQGDKANKPTKEKKNG